MHPIIILLGVIVSFVALPAQAAPVASSSPEKQFSAFVGTSTPVQTSDSIVHKLTTLWPVVGSSTAPLFAAMDTGRFAAARLLQNQIESASTHLPGTAILRPVNDNGTQNTNRLTWQGALQSIIGVLWTVYFFLLVILRFIIAKTLLFYPIFTIVIVLLLVRAYQWWRD